MEGLCLQSRVNSIADKRVCVSKVTRENVKWQRPEKNWVKLNFDGAWKGNPGTAGGGGLLRNEEGNIVAVYAESYGWKSSNYAEARALLKGIQIAADYGWTRLEIEGDCMAIVNALNNEGYGYWRNDILVEHARLICNTFQEWKCSHIYREGNRLADYMANKGVRLGDNESIVTTKDWPQVVADMAKNEIANSLPRSNNE